MEDNGAGHETLGAYLLVLREATGLGQADFARELGIAHAYAATKRSSSAKTRISKFENGHAIPPDDVLDAYAELPGADAAKLAELAQQARERRRRTRNTRTPSRAPKTTPAGAATPQSGHGPKPDLSDRPDRADSEGSGHRISGDTHTGRDNPGRDDTGRDTNTDDSGRQSGKVADHKSWWRQHLLLVAAAVVLVLAGGVGVTIAATSGSSNSDLSVLYARNGAGITVHTCPNTACSGMSLPTGSKVQMICFRDAQDVNLNYSSPRWFDIRQHSGTVRGWVHSSEVSHQTHVGRC